MIIRLATINDLDTIMSMIENGRNHIREYGIKQWTDGYPSRQLINEDILMQRGYVLLEGTEILAYYVVLNHDPCYDKIEGNWLNDNDYVAIHRSVTKTFNKGQGSLLLSELKKKYDHIRIDTHEGNISMNKCLLKNDFKYCGIIYLESGDPRNAYEWSK